MGTYFIQAWNDVKATTSENADFFMFSLLNVWGRNLGLRLKFYMKCKLVTACYSLILLQILLGQTLTPVWQFYASKIGTAFAQQFVYTFCLAFWIELNVPCAEHKGVVQLFGPSLAHIN